MVAAAGVRRSEVSCRLMVRRHLLAAAMAKMGAQVAERPGLA